MLSVDQASDAKVRLDVDTSDHHHHHQHVQQQQQQQQPPCGSSTDEHAMLEPLTGSIVTSAGSQLVRQTSSDCASSLSSSTTSEMSARSVDCRPGPATVCAATLYPLYPPYIVMGFPVTCHPTPHRLDLVTTASRKRRANKLLPPQVKRRAADRKQRRREMQHGDVVSSTTPDCCTLTPHQSTSGNRGAFPLPPETMTSSASPETEVTSPVCLVVSGDKLVYDWCGALDLTVDK